MPNRFLPAVVAALSLSLSAPAFADGHEAPGLDTVVATVNGVEITLGHMAVAKATLPDQYQQLPAEVLFPGILDQLISQTALVQSFVGETPDRVRLALDNEHRSLIAGEVVEGVMQNAVTDAALEAAYNARFAGADAGEEYNASHILVETEEEADALLKIGCQELQGYHISRPMPLGETLLWLEDRTSFASSTPKIRSVK